VSNNSEGLEPVFDLQCNYLGSSVRSFLCGVNDQSIELILPAHYSSKSNEGRKMADHISNEEALGAGEPSTFTTAAGVANAIFDAAGIRLRQVPFTPKRIKAACQNM
jgi:hypothetical protein